MKEREFIKRLNRSLKKLPVQDRNEIIRDHREHFQMARTEGRSDHEISEALGSPEDVGRTAIEEFLPTESRPIRNSVGKTVFAAISIFFFNLIFVLGPFLGLVGVWIGLWASAFTVLICGPLFITTPLLDYYIPQWTSVSLPTPFYIFMGIGVGCLGWLACIGMKGVSRGALCLMKKYWALNLRLIGR